MANSDRGRREGEGENGIVGLGRRFARHGGRVRFALSLSFSRLLCAKIVSGQSGPQARHGDSLLADCSLWSGPPMLYPVLCTKYVFGLQNRLQAPCNYLWHFKYEKSTSSTSCVCLPGALFDWHAILTHSYSLFTLSRILFSFPQLSLITQASILMLLVKRTKFASM